jgi:amino acid transporter
MLMSDETTSRERLLIRGVGRWSLLGLLINLTLGAGVLGLPSKAFALVGLHSFTALAAAALAAAAIALCFAELGSRFTATGGPYLYVREAFGGTLGFAAGWLTWVTRPLSAATLLNLLIVYAAGFFPAASTEPWRTVIIVVLVTALTGVVLSGVRPSAWLSNVLAVGKFALLAGVAALGLAYLGEGVLPEPTPAAPKAFMEAVLLMAFAFIGFESVSIVAGEVKEPRRSYPFAILLGVTLIAALYGSLLLACVMLVPDLAASERPIADLARAAGGEGAYLAVLAGAPFVLLGSIGVTCMLSPRMMFALAERGEAPSPLAAIHPRFRTPHWAVLLSGAVILLTTLFNDFLTALTFTALTRILLYIGSCAALLRLRATRPGEPAPFRVPGGPVIPLLAIAACAAITVWGGWKALPQLALIILGGYVLLGLTRLGQRLTRRKA